MRSVECLGNEFRQSDVWTLVVSNGNDGGSALNIRFGKRFEHWKLTHLYSKMSAACKTGYARRPSLRSASEMSWMDVADFVAN